MLTLAGLVSVWLVGASCYIVRLTPPDYGRFLISDNLVRTRGDRGAFCAGRVNIPEARRTASLLCYEDKSKTMELVWFSSRGVFPHLSISSSGDYLMHIRPIPFGVLAFGPQQVVRVSIAAPEDNVYLIDTRDADKWIQRDAAGFAYFVDALGNYGRVGLVFYGPQATYMQRRQKYQGLNLPLISGFSWSREKPNNGLFAALSNSNARRKGFSPVYLLTHRRDVGLWGLQRGPKAVRVSWIGPDAPTKGSWKRLSVYADFADMLAKLHEKTHQPGAAGLHPGVSQ